MSGVGLEPGRLRWEVYTDLPGLSVSDLVADPGFPWAPDLADYVTAFETPVQWGENYGARLWGFLIPPVTGSYVFYIASDDEGVLYLSRDADPANAVEIAREPAWSMPRMWSAPDPAVADAKRSDPIVLQAGWHYYVEARMKEGGGGDHLEVAWQPPGAPVPAEGTAPIPGDYLATYASSRPADWLGHVAITSPANGAEFTAPAEIHLEAQVVDAGYRVEFLANGARIGVSEIWPIRAPFPGEPIHHCFKWTNVPSGPYALTARAGYRPERTVSSAPVTVTVNGRTLRPAPGPQNYPAVAANRELYLVVWSDGRNQASGSWDIYATRVDRQGNVLDPDGIPICTQPNIQDCPSISSDGEEFLVVWHDARSEHAPADYDIYGARVTAAGRVLDPDGFVVSRAPHAQFMPALAFNGGHYLVAWYDYRSTLDLPLNDIYGARVGRDGVVLDPAGIAICAAENMQWAPGVAALGGAFQVAWNDTRRPVESIRGTRVESDGTVIHPDGVVISEHFSGYPIRLTADATGYLAAWTDSRDYAGTAYNIYARRLDVSGLPVGLEDLVLCAAPGMQVGPSVSANGTESLAVWLDARPLEGQPTVRGTRVRGADPLDLDALIIGRARSMAAMDAPAAASLSGDYLVVWVGGESGGWETCDIVGARLGSDGSLRDTRPVLISTVPRSTPRVTWIDPAPIRYGTALGSPQLCAAADTPGTFEYEPPLGTFLQAGEHSLTVLFEPADPSAFTTATAQVRLLVNQAPLTIRADTQERMEGEPNPVLTCLHVGYVLGDDPDDLDQLPTLTTPATLESPPGVYPIHVQGATDANYEITPVDGTLTVRPRDALTDPITYVPAGAVWRFNHSGSDLGTAWRALGYDDSTWPLGPAQLGYGDGDEVTLVGFDSDPSPKPITAYFRSDFEVPELRALAALTLRLLRDDGAVVYLNDVEVARDNMSPGEPRFDTLASAVAGGTDESAFHSLAIDPAGLRAGRNVLAVEVHQANPFSSDLSFDLELLGQPARPPGERELHVVGVYEGATETPGSEHPPGRAAVMLDRPGKQVTLLLSAYEPVAWQLTVAPGTTIERVILCGHYVQSATGLPDGVEVLERWAGSNEPYLYVGYVVDSGTFYRAVPQVHALAGLEIASFHGAYRAPYPEPFVIDAIQGDPRLRSDYPQPVPPDSLPDLGFQVTFFRDTSTSEAGHLFARDYRMRGPWDNAPLLPATRVAPDGFRPAYYGTAGHAVWRVDGRTDMVTPMTPGPSQPALSWPMGVAFDRERDRMLLVSLGGEGFLYGYSPASDAWTTVCGMQNIDLDCLEYHDAEDCLYGLRVTHSDTEGPSLLRFSPAGDRLGETRLPVQPFDISPGGSASEVVSAGEYLAVFFSPNPLWPTGPELGESRLYLVDPRTAEHWLVYRDQGRARNQPPSVRITSPAYGDVREAGRPLRMVARVHDPDGEVERVEFLGDGPVIGVGQRSGDPGVFVFDWADPPSDAITLVARATDNQGAVSMSVPVVITRLPGPAGFAFRELPAAPTAGEPLTVRLKTQPPPGTATYALEDRAPDGWRVTDVSDPGVFDPATGKVKFGPCYDAEPRVFTYVVWPPPGFDGVGLFQGTASADGVNSVTGGDNRMVFPGPHPADHPTADWALVMDEVTAYGAAWRHGADWPTPPTPIPIDYATRAAALWLGGEQYGVDATTDGPPTWWVNRPRSLEPLGVDADAPQAARRSLPADYVPADPFEIAIEIVAGGNILAQAVEERVPAGWAVGTISDAGTWDLRTRTIRWGPFLDQASRRLTYRVTPPASAHGLAVFQGTASFNGASSVVGGAANLWLVARLSAERSLANGTLHLRIGGEAGARYAVEASADLRTWTRVTVIDHAGGWVGFTDPAGGDPARRFYRTLRIE